MKKNCLWIVAVAGLLLSSCSQGEQAPQVGTVVRDTIQGTPCMVYLPWKVESGESGDERYPVLYLQHGMYGNENDWTEQGHLLYWMDSLLQLGEVREMVVVMPDNCPSRPTAEEEKTNAMNGAWENHFAAFMAEVEARYPVSSEPSQRAIAGLSMGGYHTMRVTQVLHGQFAYIGLFSGLLIAPDAPEKYENNQPLIWIGIGREDFLYEYVRDYRHWLEASHIEYTYYESPGGHTWDNWQDYIVRFMKLIF